MLLSWFVYAPVHNADSRQLDDNLLITNAVGNSNSQKTEKKIDVSVPILFQSHSNQKTQFVLDYENLLLIKKKERQIFNS